MSRRYRQLLLAHGATIVPMIAGMYFGGLLYGQFLMNSQEPLINSIEQLKNSELRVVHPALGMDRFMTANQSDK